MPAVAWSIRSSVPGSSVCVFSLHAAMQGTFFYLFLFLLTQLVISLALFVAKRASSFIFVWNMVASIQRSCSHHKKFNWANGRLKPRKWVKFGMPKSGHQKTWISIHYKKIMKIFCLAHLKKLQRSSE
jgi:hypothetical protein